MTTPTETDIPPYGGLARYDGPMTVGEVLLVLRGINRSVDMLADIDIYNAWNSLLSLLIEAEDAEAKATE
jgi:hypothetical protein